MSVDEIIALGVAEIEYYIAKKGNITELLHPQYNSAVTDWVKWRLTYKGGRDFINEYLRTYSDRESAADFITRKELTYNPAYAGASVNKIKDAIFQRTTDITRECNSDAYNEAVKGNNGGVDLAGADMNSFIGRDILPELLALSKVGIFLDMPTYVGQTLAEQTSVRPYMYMYKAEDILNWQVELATRTKFTKLLLRDTIYETDELIGLSTGTTTRFRYLWVREGITLVQFFDTDGEPITPQGDKGIYVQAIELKEIPFTVMSLSSSLLSDVADYQRALLNLSSSDISFILKANFPFYVEKYDPRYDNSFVRSSAEIDETGVTIIEPGEAADAKVSKTDEIKVGTLHGRRVPQAFDYPAFIHPPSEPLLASMQKQVELKTDIQHLVNLTVANLAKTDASAESKSFDERSLEAGLSAIGLELQAGETNVCRHWLMYEKKAGSPSVKYPERYNLQTDSDMRAEAKDLIDSIETSPSVRYKKEAHKLAARKLVARAVSSETMTAIEVEIDNAVAIIGSPEELTRDVELSLIDPETASLAKGYPKGTVEKAKAAHAERITRIAESQAKARGVTDLSGLENKSRDEKLNKDVDGTASKKTRGKA